jgi:aminopeptidase N
MKYIPFFLISFLVVNAIFSQENHTNCSKRDRFKNVHLKSNTLSLSQIAETEKYDVHFYGLDLSMTNVSTNLSGTVTIGAKSLVNLDSVLFELFPTLVITEIRLDGSPVGYNRSNTAVKVGVNLPPNSNFELAIDYNGNPPTAQTNPLGGSGITAGSSPSWGNKVVWTLSEPFSAMEWFPCKQSLTDKADSSFFSITVPDTLKAGSNGLLVSVDTIGSGLLKFNWEHRHPIDYYLISASVSKYVDYSIFANPVNAPVPILIQNYVYDNPNTLPNFIDEINETASFIELYYDLYGPYPFEDEKYGHCMAPISGGMEHQTMTTQGFFEKKLTAHELGHQWWGNNVTCASWADIWINEGFASYSEYLMLENLYPTEKNQHMLDVHDNVMTQTGGSVWVLDSLNENRIFSGRLTYDKGAGIIHSIRYLVNNDSLFFNALRAFQIAFSDQTAKGVDFKDFVSVYTGINLDAFFEEWYFGEGYPTYSIRWEQVGPDVLLEVSHTSSKPSITPTFTNPIDIKLNRAAAPDTIIRFPITSNTELFTISNIGPLSISATAIVDPNNWIMNKVGTVTQDNSLEIVEEIEQKNIFISPNPSGGIFTINNLEFNASLRVIDMKGNTVSNLKVQPGELIDLSRLEKGTYLIEISLPNGNKRLKLVQF